MAKGQGRVFASLALVGMVLLGTGLGQPDVSLTGPVDPTSAIYAHAREHYGQNVSAVFAEHPLFSHFFPGFQLARVYNTTFYPPVESHYLAYNPTLNVSYDSTLQFNLLLQASGVTMANASQALNVSKLFAAIGNGELDGDKQVVYSTDSSWLGVNVTSPNVTTMPLGWQVELFTWSFRNGVLANWTLRMETTRLSEVAWRIINRSIGPQEFEGEALQLDTGYWVKTNFNLTGTEISILLENGTSFDVVHPLSWLITQTCPVIVSRTNYDNTSWVVHGALECEVNDEVRNMLGPALADAGVFSYDSEIRDWGLPQFSTTGVHHIHIIVYPGTIPSVLNCLVACVLLPINETHIYVNLNFLSILQGGGYYRNSTIHNLSSISKSIIGHEFMHVIQAGIYRWGPNFSIIQYRFMTEGIARFAQSSLLPIVEHDSTAYFYAGTSDGVNGFMRSPKTPPANSTYQYALVWGYAFSKNDGYRLLNESMYAAANASVNGNVGANSSITAAMGNLPGTHDTFGDALLDLAVALYKRYPGQFTWGDFAGSDVRDWGRYLEDAFLEEAKPSGGEYSITTRIGAWGMGYVRLPTDGTYEIVASAGLPVTARVFRISGSTFDSTNLVLGQALTLNLTGYERAAVSVLRTGSTDGSFTVTYRVT